MGLKEQLDEFQIKYLKAINKGPVPSWPLMVLCNNVADDNPET